MHRNELLATYVRWLAVSAFACAVLELLIAATNHRPFLSGIALGPVDKAVFSLYVFLILLFFVSGVGLWRKARWVYATVLIASAVGTITLVTLFLAGIGQGGILPGTAAILEQLLAPVDAIQLAKEAVLVLAPFVLFFNPLNLWLFARDPTLKGVFLSEPTATPALKRKEL